MSTTITYDEFMFTGSEGFPTPYVSRTQNMLEYGNRWGQEISYTLNGQITGNNFEDVINKQNILLSGFSKDYKNLNVTEGGESVAGFPAKNCRINNVSFDANKYANILDYSIDINTYDESLFSGTYGVIDPTDEINISENEDGSISVQHSVTAKGFSANDKSAVENAKDFVHLHSGWKNLITPQFVTYQKKQNRYYSNQVGASPFLNWAGNDGNSTYPNTIGGKDDCLKYTLNSNLNDDHYAYINNVFTAGKKYKIFGEVYLQDISYADVYAIGIFDQTTDINSPILEAGSRGSWVSFETEEFSASTSNLYIYAKNGSDYNLQGDSHNRDWFAIKNIRIEEVLPFEPILISQGESIDRINGSYGINEVYSLYKTGENQLLSGHSVDISSGIGQEYVQVGLNVNYRGHYNEHIDQVRGKIPSLNSINYYNLATGTSQILNLNSGALNFNVEENSGDASISVSCSFSNNELFTGSNAFFDYNVSFNTDEIRSITSTQIQGQIITIGNNKDKLKAAEDFLENTVYTQSHASNHEAKYAGFLYNIANEEYTKLSKAYSIRSYPESVSISKDEINGIISLSASFDDSYQYSDNVKSSNWNIQVTPPLRKYIPTQDVLTFPKHIFWNTNVVSRSRIQASASASSYDSINKSFGLTTVDNFITSVYNLYVDPNIDTNTLSNTLNFNEKTLTYNRSKSWGFHNNTEWITLPAPPKP